MKYILRSHAAAAALLLGSATAMVGTPALAQQRAAVETPAIRSLALSSSDGLEPGATLRVNVRATPGARAAHVTLGDSGVRIALAERGDGRYVGTHTIRRGERIDPTERIAVRARYGRQAIAATVAYPAEFQAMARDGRGAPEIERFVLNARGGIEPGREVRFRLAGEAGGRAWVRIPGVDDVQLREQQPGVYVGDYTVRRRDDPRAFERAVAILEENQRRSTARVTVRNDDEDGRDRDRHGRHDLPLEVTSHVNNAAIDAQGQLTLRGRTAPHASVHVQVQPSNPFTGLIGIQAPPSQQWVRADANGRFVASIQAQGLPLPGTRYDVTLRASSGTQTAEESLTLYQRQG